MASDFLPALSQSDVERATQLIQQAYAPPTPQTSSEDQRRLQQELFDIQKRPEAWGLVIPFLENQDQNVQFFGAHTAQVKIVRDWDSFPQDHAESLRDLLLELTTHSILVRRSKVILRKLFVALSSLALKLSPTRPTRWPDWILACVTSFSSRGASTEYILDFLTIVAEEVQGAELLGGTKMQMQQTLNDAVPMVVHAITASISRPVGPGSSSNELQAALSCFEAWLSILPSNDITPLIPALMALLSSSPTSSESFSVDSTAFVGASSALQELMSKSAFSDGSGSKIITEPLLVWLDTWSAPVLAEGDSEVRASLCKLLVALGDHSTNYLAANIASPAVVSLTPSSTQTLVPVQTHTKGHLTQAFLRLMLEFTALPGYHGVDEDESELTLGFWYLFQEALWSTDYFIEEGDEDEQTRDAGLEGRENERENEQWAVAKAVYAELVKALRNKVTFPPWEELSRWSKDQKEVFQVYRRDVGDTLINAYYVLRNDMLGYYINDIIDRLSKRQQNQGWEDVEATLHCLMSIQEAVPLEDNVYLSRIFSSEILGSLPTTGHIRIRRTILGLIGAYASWFTTQSSQTSPTGSPSLLMNTIGYVVTALTEPSLCLQAANALRDLCDANRAALAPHIGAFAELHAGLTGIPDTEKSKVLQSIASVIQALPPEDEIPPIEAIVSPVVNKLVEAIHSSTNLPDEARALAIMQLQTITGVAKGLTRATDSLLTIDESPEEQAETARMRRARDDLRMIKLREAMFAAIRNTVDLWSTDAAVSSGLSDLFKSITSLPADTTLLSLPAGPLLELVCFAAQRHFTSVWLSLASMLILQLNPPLLFPPTIKSGPNAEVHAIISSVLPVLLQTALSSLSQPGAMIENPDVVRDFFGCMDTIAQNFITAFYRLPAGALDALVHCAISCLALQERYSLVSACNFLGTLVNRTFVTEELSDARIILVQTHGRSILRAVLCGFAGVTPRTATPNLIELLSTLLSRCAAECRTWIGDILASDDFVASKAGPEAKEKFVKAVMSSRSLKRIREAAQQFTLVARGLEGSTFGYASVTM